MKRIRYKSFNKVQKEGVKRKKNGKKKENYTIIPLALGT
jgi:hypothetical protein